MQNIIIHTHDNRQQSVPQQGHTLAQCIFLAGLWEGVPLCAGMGRCGLCRVRFLSAAPAPQAEELKRFTQDELDHGWRLACLHPPQPCELELPAPRGTKPEHSLLARPESTTRHNAIALAVDLGTTSVHWQAFTRDATIAQGNALNPQIGLGSEVMARLAFAATADGSAILRKRITAHLRNLIASLPGQVTSLAVSGNPTMIALLLGLPTQKLASAPYALPDVCGREFALGEGLPPAYIPPLFSPFVGADLSAGLAALHFSEHPPKPPYLLSDLGTNGEFILELADKRIITSVPMGPALEGVGLSSGTTAGPGVITAFRLTPKGLAPLYGAGDPKPGHSPSGMTGTAALSLCALLLRNGLLQPEGQFSAGQTPLAQRLAATMTTSRGEPALTAVPNTAIQLTASDVEEVLKVKAAFNLAFSALLQTAGLTSMDLTSLQLAGAMGEHVGLDDLERLGFLPAGMGRKTVRAGNTSLRGTRLLMARPETRDWLENITPPQVVDLASDPAFGGQYLERMVFTHVP